MAIAMLCKKIKPFFSNVLRPRIGMPMCVDFVRGRNASQQQLLF